MLQIRPRRKPGNFSTGIPVRRNGIMLIGFMPDHRLRHNINATLACHDELNHSI